MLNYFGGIIMENTNEIITYYMYKVDCLNDEINDLKEQIKNLERTNLSLMSKLAEISTEKLKETIKQ